MRRVVVTGLGLVTPVGLNTLESWAAARGGKTGVAKITHFDASNFNVQIAAEVKNFMIGDALDAKEANRAPRFLQYTAKAAQEAVRHGGIVSGGFDPERAGTCIGVGLGSMDLMEENHQTLLEKGPKRVSPFLIPHMIANMASGLVSKLYNLKGPNMCSTTACASGTHGIGESFLYIKNNLADVMVCGGAEAAITPLSLAGFNVMKALSTQNNDPTTASRPFDLNRDGFVMGEGAGLFVLEELEHARRRGVPILAEVVGYGMSGDAYHMTSPAPDGDGARRCMAAALAMSETASDQIDYINAHGTSTKLNDLYETRAIQNLFGEHTNKLSISSTKGVTGHCLGAAGGIEAVFTVMALVDQTVPPTAGLQTPDPECPLDYTPLDARRRVIRYAMSNSFGFGGTNASLILKRWEA